MWPSPFGCPGQAGGHPVLSQGQWLPRMGGYSNAYNHPGLTDTYWNMAMGGNFALQDEGVRNLTEYYTNSEDGLASPEQIQRIVMLAQDERKRKIILEVLKSRLNLSWPCNYKALDVLSNLPADCLVGMLDKLSEFASPAAGVYGADELKKVTNTFIEKVKAEKAKKEAEEFEKKQKEVSAMWGPLWTNSPPVPAFPGHICFPTTAHRPVPYPYVPPGISCPPVTWPNGAPEGWSTTAIQPPTSHAPFSRVTFHALQPDPPKDAKGAASLQPIIYMPPREKKG